jgi:hypothetical protein
MAGTAHPCPHPRTYEKSSPIFMEKIGELENVKHQNNYLTILNVCTIGDRSYGFFMDFLNKRDVALHNGQLQSFRDALQ